MFLLQSFHVSSFFILIHKIIWNYKVVRCTKYLSTLRAPAPLMPPNRPNGDGACVCPAQTPDHHHNNRQPRQGLTRRPIRWLHSVTWLVSTNHKRGKNTWTIVGQSILRVKGRNQAFYQLMFCGHLGETETDEYKVLKNEETPQATIRRWNHVYKYVVKNHYKCWNWELGAYDWTLQICSLASQNICLGCTSDLSFHISPGKWHQSDKNKVFSGKICTRAPPLMTETLITLTANGRAGITQILPDIKQILRDIKQTIHNSLLHAPLHKP